MGRRTAPSTPSYGKSTPSSKGGGGGGPGVSLVHSVSSLWAKCTRAAKKMAANSPKSPLAKPKSPKQLLLTLSNKAMAFKQKKKVDPDRQFVDDEGSEVDFGDGGLWQRSILLGDKCQPLDFSGVIYYDIDGKQLSEFPMRSPRASPLPSYLFASSEK